MAEPMLLKSTDTQTVVQVGKQVYLPSTLHEAIVSFLVSYRDSINRHLDSKIRGTNSRIMQPGRAWISGQVSIKICLEFVPGDQTSASETLDHDRLPIDAATSPLDDLRATLDDLRAT
ncbi:KGK domain-containing protein [Synechococcus sp. O70.2]|uniref:KGK domain-containing protein n=1 Tax=Synechococcus sp. O70.2 TaxID=2964533 RepID=UPI0039C02D2F